MSDTIMQFFEYKHLPINLRQPSADCAELAHEMDALLCDSDEKSTGMRKLLEAKDCFVRARLLDAKPLPRPKEWEEQDA